MSDERESPLAIEFGNIEHNGNTFNNYLKILQACHDHYSKPFGCSAGVGNHFRSFLDPLPKLSVEERALVAEQIMLSEVEVVIKALQTNKSACPDALGAEFCQKFCTVLAPVLLTLFANAYEISSPVIRFSCGTNAQNLGRKPFENCRRIPSRLSV